jgi:uncharacterized membrane-anchored protein
MKQNNMPVLKTVSTRRKVSRINWLAVLKGYCYGCALGCAVMGAMSTGAVSSALIMVSMIAFVIMGALIRPS